METQLLPDGPVSTAPVHVLGAGLPLNFSSKQLCESAGSSGGCVALDGASQNSQYFVQSDGH